ncbi:MAG: PAS domain S-box protein, partial [Verrucomicrobiota bacterium]|nr:PAS domain S-box protein [Verrucomicrobiota bacterium]
MSEKAEEITYLRECAERLRAILDTAVEAIITIDERGCIESANPATERMFGFSAAEMLGQNVSMLMPSPDRERHDGYLANYLRTGEAKIIGTRREVMCKRHDGSLFPADLSVSETRLAKRRIFTGLLRDITGRKRSEEALRQSDARKTAMFESSLDAVITMDHEGKILEFNPAAEKTFGYQREEAIGNEMAALIVPPALRSSHRRGLQHYLATGEGPVLNHRITITAMRRDHTEFPVELAIVRIREEEPPIFTGFIRDLTERKHAEQALRAKDSQLTLVTDITPVALTQCSRDRRFIFVNRAYAHLLQRTPEEIIGRPMVEIIGEEAYATILPQVEKVLRGEPVEFEEEIAFKGVSSRFLRAAYQPHRNEAGEVVGWVGSLSDITEKKQAEQESQESRARLEGIVRSAMDAIITIDDEQRVVLFNTAAEKLFACPAKEALGSPIERFIPARSREAHAKRFRRFGETGATSRWVGTLDALIAMRADGEEFPIEASISQVEVRGRMLFTVILRDVTERARTEAAAKVRTRQHAAVAELSQHALAGRDLDGLLTDAVALLAQVLEVEFAKVLELTPAGDELVLCAGVGWREGSVGTQKVPARREFQAGYTLLVQSPVVVADLSEETRFRGAPLLVQHRVVSGMTTVIHGRVRPFGVLGVDSTRARSFSSDDVHFLQSVADVLAAAMERRELEQELLAATGREQRRIGQDLHDGLCQHLAGIEYRTEALARDLDPHSAVHDEVEKIGALIRQGTRQARMLSRGLAPVELEANGLMSALGELCAQSAQLYRV